MEATWGGLLPPPTAKGGARLQMGVGLAGDRLPTCTPEVEQGALQDLGARQTYLRSTDHEPGHGDGAQSGERRAWGGGAGGFSSALEVS